MFGKELILDLHNCNVKKFNRKDLSIFFEDLCALIDMVPEDLYFWDDPTEIEPNLSGTSAIQFIRTSNITIHALDLLGKVFINVFSCKDFDVPKTVKFCAYFFEGQIAHMEKVNRI